MKASIDIFLRTGEGPSWPKRKKPDYGVVDMVLFGAWITIAAIGCLASLFSAAEGALEVGDIAFTGMAAYICFLLSSRWHLKQSLEASRSTNRFLRTLLNLYDPRER